MESSVLYIVNARWPTEKAHGYQISQMCQAFIERGEKLELWHADRINSPELEKCDIQQYYGLRNDIPSVAIPSNDWHPKLGRWGSVASFIAYFIQSRSFFRATTSRLQSLEHLPIIFLRDGDLAIWLKRQINGVGQNMIVELHQMPRRAWRRVQLVNHLQGTRMVVTLTRALKQQLIELGLPGHQIHVAPDAVDWDTFDMCISQSDARTKLRLPAQRKIAAYVGKFHTNGQEKGIPEIIQAAGLLMNAHPDLHFYFVGGPISRVAQYQKLARRCGITNDRLVFLDKQPISDVPFWLKASDLLLMPHPKNEFYEKHVSPLKMFEYMSSGRPIIASKLKAIEEILTDGKTAMLTEPSNPRDLAHAISKALVDKKKAELIGGEAKRIGRQYTWGNRVKEIMSRFNELR